MHGSLSYGQTPVSGMKTWMRKIDLVADLSHVHEVAHALDDEVGGGAVQARRDFVHEQSATGPHKLLACQTTAQASASIAPMYYTLPPVSAGFDRSMRPHLRMAVRSHSAS